MVWRRVDEGVGGGGVGGLEEEVLWVLNIIQGSI